VRDSIGKWQEYIPALVALIVKGPFRVFGQKIKLPLTVMLSCASFSKDVGAVTTLTSRVWYDPAATPLFASAVGPELRESVTDVNGPGPGA